MEVKLGRFTDGKEEWVSIIIDNISVAQQAVKDVVGAKLCDIELNAHCLYTEGKSFVDFGTARTVFNNICDCLYQGKRLIMNKNGGYTREELVDWELVEEMKFDFHYKDNLNNLLQQQNGKVDNFKRI